MIYFCLPVACCIGTYKFVVAPFFSILFTYISTLFFFASPEREIVHGRFNQFFSGRPLLLPKFSFCISGVTDEFVFSDDSESTSESLSCCGIAGVLVLGVFPIAEWLLFHDWGVLKCNPLGCRCDPNEAGNGVIDPFSGWGGGGGGGSLDFSSSSFFN